MFRRIAPIVMAVLVLFAVKVSAAQSDSMLVKVTIAASLSVSINAAEYDFGNMSPGAVSISVTSATITNDSAGIIEDYTIDCSTYTAAWTIDPDGNPGADQFSLQALFKESLPTASDFGSSDYLNDSDAQQNMLDPDFTVDYSGYDGNNVSKDVQRSLWFRMHAPSETTTTTEQSVTVTVTAENSSTF
jgi:uncharacterized membrane protein